MAIVTPALLQSLKTGFKGEFEGGLTMATPQWTKAASRIPSSTASNTYGWLGQFPGFREWVGDRVLKDMAAQGYQITNKLFESTVSVKRTDIEDDSIGVYAPLFQEMGRASQVFPDELVFGLLKTGGSTLCYDGQFFFDTDHPVFPNVDGTGTAALVSNVAAGAGDPWYLLDTGRAVKPLIYQEREAPVFTSLTNADDEYVFTKDVYRYGVRARSNVGFGFWQMAYKSSAVLDQTHFNAAMVAMMSQKADGGRPLAVTPSLLIVPPSLRSAAQSLIESLLINGGDSNPNYHAVEVLVCPWLV